MLYYLHGYQSSPTSAKGTLFKDILQAIPITYREGAPEDLVIPQCLHRIKAVVEKDRHAVLIGSSLGGFLAASIALATPTVTHLMLLNPAIIPPDTDLQSIQGIPPRILQDMVQPRLFDQKIPALITIFRGTDDTVVPDSWVLSFAKAQQAMVHFLKDDHQFSAHLQQLPALISASLRMRQQP
ncbi:MAG: hypothetical protein JXA00_06210 [Candidatus Thermoplasmatota archaeon]|nr:hypothetical protein [Candidatus Thermoplasmatota archaeon]